MSASVVPIRKLGDVLVCACKREGEVTDEDGTSWRVIHELSCYLNDDVIDFTPPRTFAVVREDGRSAIYTKNPGRPAKRLTRWRRAANSQERKD